MPWPVALQSAVAVLQPYLSASYAVLSTCSWSVPSGLNFASRSRRSRISGGIRVLVLSRNWQYLLGTGAGTWAPSQTRTGLWCRYRRRLSKSRRPARTIAGARYRNECITFLHLLTFLKSASSAVVFLLFSLFSNFLSPKSELTGRIKNMTFRRNLLISPDNTSTPTGRFREPLLTVGV